MMKYKEYQAHISYDEERELFHGEITGIKDVVTFQGKSVDELKKAMKDSVDDYIAWCEERGKEPNRPYSGNFIVRVGPELHQAVMIASEAAGKSMNSWMESMLMEVLKPRRESLKKPKRLKKVRGVARR